MNSLKVMIFHFIPKMTKISFFDFGPV